jgi:DNA-binding NarL/FixJ family response regulator
MCRILIADPDPATRKALNLLLRCKLGSDDIVEIGDVETLIQTLVDAPPDLLILDWGLHGSPAPATCRLLRKAYPQLQVVLLSLDTGNALATVEAGGIFIHKGAAPDELIATLTPLLRIEQ